LRWFNHWLKDSREFESEPMIRYFALGANEWRTVPEWPVDALYPLYLRSDGNANSRKGNGILSTCAPIADEPCDVFVYDPEVPVSAPGGPQALSGSFDQALLESGNNLLVYTSPTVVRGTEIFGQPHIKLHAATSTAHADFTAKLVRVKPNGRTEFLCMGIARSSWLFRETGYAADAIHAWEFSLEPIAFVLAPGERLRLEIASSAFPLYDRNPSTTTPPQLADNWNWTRSTQRVLHTATHPSALFLPLKGEHGW
jgi:putative CocE/NonD family hydrolase